MKDKTVDIITLGCSKNLVDSERLLKQFEVLGYDVRHDSESPDGEVVVVNTCGFIGDAKEESIDTILNLVEKKKQNGSKLFVMGCLSERYLNDLEEEIPEVDKYFGKFNYSNILQEIGQEQRADLRLERTLTTPSHYAYVKISEGCNRTCSYCAIPIITGKHRSRKIEDIVREVEILVDKGVKEFQLIAQDLTFYGLDRYKENKLSSLIRNLSDVKGVEWIRLHYGYPSQFPVDILPVIKERENVCSYLDIALQHISNRMLKKMRRNVTKNQTIDLINRIREEVPNIHLRTTMLVGHPEESDEDFQELLEFVEKTRFERLGAFAYSHEEGTFAGNNYIDNVPYEVKEERLEKLMQVQQYISQDIQNRKIGKELKVIIDKAEEDFYVGRTEFDSPEVDPEVIIPITTKNIKVGDFYQAKIVDATEFELIGQ